MELDLEATRALSCIETIHLPNVPIQAAALSLQGEISALAVSMPPIS